MSTRINKSTTKFVPKKRSKPSSAPAPSGVSSVGGSVAGTPRVAALGLDGLAPLSEIAGEDGFTSPAPPAKAQASGASMRGRENAAGASQSQAGLSHGPSSGFAGSTQAASFSSSDPTFSQIQQTQSTAPSSFAATPKSGAGTAFTFSQTGPAQAAAAPSSQQADEEEEPLPVQPKKKQLSGRNMEEVLASRLANDVEANANANANVNALGLGMDLDPASSPPPLPAAGPGLVNRVASPKKLTAAEKGKGKAVVAPPVEDEAPLPPKIAPIAPGKPAAPKKPKAVRKSRARIRTPPPPVYDADGVLIPPPPVIPKRTRGPNKPKIPRARVMRMIDGVEVEGFASDEEPVPKRRRAVKKAKATKLDLEIFDNPKLDGHGAAADEEESGEPELDENGVAIPKKAKGKKKAEEVELPTVDSGTWTMSSISTPRDVIGGRISARFLDCQKKDIATKQARNLRRKKMRDRATRRAKGEPSASEAEDEPVLPLDHAEVKKNESRANSEKVVAGAKTAEQEDAEELAKMNRLYPDEAEENERVIKENRKNKEAPNPLPDLAPLADVDDPMVDHVREGTARAGEGEQEYDSDGDLVETQYAPQMRIVDGEMVLDDASLEVDRSKDAKLGHVGEREIIEESARDRYVNSGTWGKQRKTEKWTNTETLYFYDLLGQFGTDFEMIARLFPTRTRGQIKAKWMKEEKINSAGVTVALMSKKPIDLVTYAKVTGKNLAGPVPIDPNEAVQKRRDEEDKQKREATTQFGANGRDEVEEQVPVTTGKGKKGKKQTAAAAAAQEVCTMEVDADYVQPVEEVPEVEEDPEEVARQLEADAEIAAAEEEERKEARKKKKRGGA